MGDFISCCGQLSASVDHVCTVAGKRSWNVHVVRIIHALPWPEVCTEISFRASIIKYTVDHSSSLSVITKLKIKQKHAGLSVLQETYWEKYFELRMENTIFFSRPVFGRFDERENVTWGALRKVAGRQIIRTDEFFVSSQALQVELATILQSRLLSAYYISSIIDLQPSFQRK